jgi:DNA-binding GntR family transcriptional regulator
MLTAKRSVAKKSVGEEASGPTRERVYVFVCEQILKGHFAGGSFIEEEQISSAINVSRTPVREAFHRLEAEKFIDLLPRRGALVRQVTASELTDVYESRRVIEGYSIARICQERLPVPAEMTALLKRMQKLRQTNDHYEHVLADCMFHRAMVAACGNAVLAETYDSLRSRQLRVAMKALTVDPGRIQRIFSEHQELLESLTAHDEARARGIIDQHLRPVLEVVSRLPGFSLHPAGED